MKRQFLSLGFLAIAGCSGAPTSIEEPELRYSLTPVFSETESHLNVSLQFTGDIDGETNIRVGGRWARDLKAGSRFRHLKVAGEGAVLTGDRGQAMLTVTHVPKAELTISYTLSSEDMDDAESDIEYFYVPVIMPDVIHLIGSTSLIMPVPDERKAYDVVINWPDLPEGWTAKDTLPDRAVYPGEIVSQLVIAAPSESIAVVGETYELTILKTGSHAFSDNAFKNRMATAFESLNSLWRANEPKFLISLLGTPERASYSAFTGTGRFNSFASAASADIELDFLTQFLMHEVAHHWMPGKLGNWPKCKEGEACQPRISWFSEGFTDFVMTRAMLREGRWTQADLVDYTNQYLRDYYLSPAQTAKGSEIDDLFWEDYEYEKQPYWRGFLLAMNWDSDIKRRTQGAMSAMDVLLGMYEMAERSKDGRPVLTQDYIAQAFSEAAGRNVGGDVKRFYNDGETLKPNANLFPDCAKLSSAPAFQYDVGFDAQATLGSGIISGVAKGHNAAKAGLKNGQALIAKVSGGGGDTTSPLILEVEQGDETLTISYLPVSGTPTDIPQFKITGECTD